MKIALSLLLFLLSFQSYSFVPSFNPGADDEIVLGFDKSVTARENPLRFPCIRSGGETDCNRVKFENKVCERTFFVERIDNQMELSCLIGLKKVVIGYSDARTYNTQSQRDQFGIYRLTLSNKVSFVRATRYNLLLKITP